MKNVCDSCEKQRGSHDGWYCTKYGVVLHAPRIYCISNEKKRDTSRKGMNKEDLNEQTYDHREPYEGPGTADYAEWN